MSLLTKTVYRRTHVLVESRNRYGNYPEANYLGTGLALAGVLKENETLDQWKKRTGYGRQKDDSDAE